MIMDGFNELSMRQINAHYSKPFLPLNNSIQLTPDMMVFDFQLLHPMSQTSIFSVTN